MSIQRAIELFEMAHEELHGAYRSGKMEGFVQAIIQAAANEVQAQMPIDWKRERIAMARAAMQGLLANPNEGGPTVVQDAVWHADKLIAKLQKEVQP